MITHRLTVLGATGSIGQSTLRLVEQHPERLSIFALTSHRQTDVLLRQARRHKPAVVVLGDAIAAQAFKSAWPLDEGRCPEVLHGSAGLEAVASDAGCTTVMGAIVGAAGLSPLWKAAEAGKTVLLANKEALVLAGQAFMALCRRHQARLLPIDSEHSAIFQCLDLDTAGNPDIEAVRALLLTASGGPLRQLPLEAFAAVTPEQACAHPIWSMGRKISVDSATMMNKALEIIEAHWLFGVPIHQIKALIHPQGIVHSMVEFIDGTLLAQMGVADMQAPIAYALGYPQRIAAGTSFLDLTRCSSLSFEPVDPQRFPGVQLAYQALEAGQGACTMLNAANEVAVAAFLEGRLGFDQIVPLISRSLERHALTNLNLTNLDDLLASDQHARRLAESVLQSMTQGAQVSC